MLTGLRQSVMSLSGTQQHAPIRHTVPGPLGRGTVRCRQKPMYNGSLGSIFWRRSSLWNSHHEVKEPKEEVEPRNHLEVSYFFCLILPLRDLSPSFMSHLLFFLLTHYHSSAFCPLLSSFLSSLLMRLLHLCWAWKVILGLGYFIPFSINNLI